MIPARDYQPAQHDAIGQLDDHQDAMFSLPRPSEGPRSPKPEKPMGSRILPELEESPSEATESGTIRGGLGDVIPGSGGLPPETDTQQDGQASQEDTQQGIPTAEGDTQHDLAPQGDTEPHDLAPEGDPEQHDLVPQRDTEPHDLAPEEGSQHALAPEGDPEQHPAPDDSQHDLAPEEDSGQHDLPPDRDSSEPGTETPDSSSVTSSIGPSASQTGPTS